MSEWPEWYGNDVTRFLIYDFIIGVRNFVIEMWNSGQTNGIGGYSLSRLSFMVVSL